MIQCPRLTIAGLGGDTGKTAVSVGLCRAWKKQGYRVVPFKKGPDYIDMGWMGRGGGHPCYNLDLFLMNQDQVLSSFSMNTRNADIVVIEGNRGLYDGLDADGSVSTAEVAKILQTPVVLIIDCTKVTRTVAALVLGCQTLDPAVPMRGVILNRLAGSRHESVIRQSLERYCHVPVLGAIPKLKNINFPGRHLGLVPPQEHPVAEDAIEKAAAVVAKQVCKARYLQFGDAFERRYHELLQQVPAVVMAHYLQGETLIEAYWKSVQMPGQGLFIGEPLARPFAGISHQVRYGGMTLSARLLTPGLYDVQAAPSMMGPYRNVGRLPVNWGTREIKLDKIPPAYYRFERHTDPLPAR